MRFLNRFLVVAAVVSSAAAAAAQDLTIVSKVSRDGGPPETTTSYLSADHIRISHGDKREMIVDYKQAQMISIDHAKKTYSVTTVKDVEAWAAKMEEQLNSPEMRQTREAMKNLPPEQRRAMENMGAGMFEVTKAGTSRKIAGYSCEDWTVAMGRLSRSEECLTSELQFPVHAYDMYKSYMESMRRLMSSMSAMGMDWTKATEQFKKMRGYPLAVTTTVDVMGRKSVTRSEVVEVKKGSIPASAWEIPSGYPKVDNPFARGFEGRRRR